MSEIEEISAKKLLHPYYKYNFRKDNYDEYKPKKYFYSFLNTVKFKPEIAFNHKNQTANNFKE